MHMHYIFLWQCEQSIFAVLDVLDESQQHQIPEMVLTIGQMKQGDDTYLCVAPVKNRYGRADQTGSNYVSLSFDPESMYLEDVAIRYQQEGIM